MLPALFPYKLLPYGFRRKYKPQRFIPKQKDLKSKYDVVIIGGGGHALACAYYLARDHGITDVCILEKGYLAGGNTARNTAIIRSNYLTPEGVRFYEQSLKLYRDLSQDFDFNILYSERGHFTLAHTDAAVRTSRWRAEVNKQLGVDSELIFPDEIHRLCPHLNMSDHVRYPILGALYHPPGSIARHDAVAWGYARGATARGAEVHQQTPVTGIIIENGTVKGVETPRGRVYANKVMQAVAGSTSVVAKMAGFRLPIRTIPLQACVSVPLKPFLDQIIVSGSLHVYVSQSSRGELVSVRRSDVSCTPIHKASLALLRGKQISQRLSRTRGRARAGYAFARVNGQSLHADVLAFNVARKRTEDLGVVRGLGQAQVRRNDDVCRNPLALYLPPCCLEAGTRYAIRSVNWVGRRAFFVNARPSPRNLVTEGDSAPYAGGELVLRNFRHGARSTER